MNFAQPHRWLERSGRHGAMSGVALVIGLCLLLVLTVMAVSGVTAALLEQRMAGNEQYQSRAFEAAEAGIEQALAAGAFTVDPSASSTQFDNSAWPDPLPRRGQGTPIAGCPDQSADPEGQCEYFLRFDPTTGITPVPGSGSGADPTQRACHFVVESFGVAARGANASLTASFYLVGPADCSGPLIGPPVRTWWRQHGAD
jgi:type IV pilus assembly protein PilX